MLPRVQPDGAGVGREAEPGHVAGRLAVRAQRQGGIQKGDTAADIESVVKYFLDAKDFDSLHKSWILAQFTNWSMKNRRTFNFLSSVKHVYF